MNKKDRIKYWRRELLKHGKITLECYREPDKDYLPYRKGSYYIQFNNEDFGMSCGAVNKYKAYQSVYNSYFKEFLSGKY